MRKAKAPPIINPKMSACDHAATSCTVTCACLCDFCQENYEKNWVLNTAEHGLCSLCGTPKIQTIESLKESRYIHFYQPCGECKPAFLDLMAQHKMCPQCQELLTGDKCLGCFCTGNVEECICRQCVAAREAKKNKKDE